MHIKGFKVQFNDKEICIIILGVFYVHKPNFLMLGHILYSAYEISLAMPKVDSTEERLILQREGGKNRMFHDGAQSCCGNYLQKHCLNCPELIIHAI